MAAASTNRTAAQAPADLSVHDLLEEIGFGGPNESKARAALEEAGLTRAGKQRIASRKREDVENTLRGRFALSCQRPGCQKEAQADPGREVLVAQRPADCEVCGGSDNRLAIDRLCQALSSKSVKRLVIVGGSPSARETLSSLVGARLQLRLVDGVARRTRADAQADLKWADLVVVWGGTMLDHKVSLLYTDGDEGHVIAVHRRGIAALVTESLVAIEKDQRVVRALRGPSR